MHFFQVINDFHHFSEESGESITGSVVGINTTKFLNEMFLSVFDL